MELVHALEPTFKGAGPLLSTRRTDASVEDAGAILEFDREDRIFDQGDPTDSVMQIVEGRVRLSICSSAGRDAVIGTLGAGAFLGEEGIAGRARLLETATAMTPCKIRVFTKEQMLRRLRTDAALSRELSTHLLSRRIRLEADLADQLMNPSEQRLARRLYLLARESSEDGTDLRVPAEISQSLLADMVGTTRSRVNHFLAGFKKRGLIQFDRGIRVDVSMRKLLDRA